MNREQVMGEVSNDLSIYTSGDSSLEDGSDDEFGLPHPNCSSHDNFLHTQSGDETTALHNPNYSSLDMFLEPSDTQSRDETATLETSIEILNNLATENNDPLSFINEDATKNTSSIKSRYTMQRDASTENRHLAHDINEYSEELKVIQAFLENYNESRSLENDQDEMNTNDYVSYMETNASSPNAIRNTFLYCLRTNDAHLADRLLRDIGIEYIIRHCMVYDGIFTTRHDAKSADDDLTRQTSCTNMFWLCSFYGSSDVMKMLIEECWIFFVEEETGGVVEPCQEVEDRADIAMSSLLNDDVESYGCTPLFIAAAQNHASIIKVLLEHKVNPDAVNGVGSTAAIVAASMDNLSALEALGETKSVVVDFNKANRDDITPLLAASQYGSVECVRYLTDFTGPTDERIVNCKVHNSKGLGCAAVAAKNNKHKVVDFFCQINDLNSERGIDINQSTRDEGNTVLHIAALYNSKETMQALLQMIPREIDPLRRNKDGMTALHIAASRGHVEIVKEFVNSLRDEMKELDTADKIGMTPLFYASWKGFKEIVTLLAPLSDTNRLCTVPVLKRPRPSASSNIDFDETSTPTPSRKTTTVQKPALIAAVNRGHIDIVYTLLYCGADPNQVDHKGHTALSHAAKDGRLDIVEILVTQGADPKLRSKGGRLPVHKARKYKHFEVVDYLEKCI